MKTKVTTSISWRTDCAAVSSGAAKVVAELLTMSRKTVKNRLKLVTDKKIASGNPGPG